VFAATIGATGAAGVVSTYFHTHWDATAAVAGVDPEAGLVETASE